MEGGVFIDEIPVHQVPEISNVIRTTILLINIIGMFPYIDAHKRCLALADGVVLVGRGYDFKIALIQNQPGPSAAKTCVGGIAELFLEVVEAAKRVVNGRGQVAILDENETIAPDSPIWRAVSLILSASGIGLFFRISLAKSWPFAIKWHT